MIAPYFVSRKHQYKNVLSQKLLIVFVGAVLMGAACSPVLESPAGEVGAIENINGDEQASQLGNVKDQDVCSRPYSKSSIWNVPIDWSVARIHPDSGKMMDAFWNGTRWIGSDPSQYAPNIYFVDGTTPLVPVKLSKNRFRDAFNDMEIQYGEPASTIWMPVPPGAQPAPGTDGQLVVVNRDTGEEWGINKGEIDLLGNWLADGAYRYHIRNSGVPPLGFGQRGAGIGNYSGIIRRCEVERGSIEHAVTLAYDYPCAPDVCRVNGWPEVIPPFTKTDGRGLSNGDIPEGARIVIHPEISKEEIIKACSGVKGCIVWVVAMQKFGGFIVDNSGHPKTYPEGSATANWDEKIWSSDMLRNIPPEWYDVIDWNFPSTIVQ
ncbi:MAG: hypothetical protein Q8L41_01980 [Anaerolineales bacterium]|nr:hypothetical protein [Anaerolineales bacterium]